MQSSCLFVRDGQPTRAFLYQVQSSCFLGMLLVSSRAFFCTECCRTFSSRSSGQLTRALVSAVKLFSLRGAWQPTYALLYRVQLSSFLSMLLVSSRVHFCSKCSRVVLAHVAGQLTRAPLYQVQSTCILRVVSTRALLFTVQSSYFIFFRVLVANKLTRALLSWSYKF